MTQAYPYKPKMYLLILCIVFLAPFAWFFGDLAYTNDRGLILSIGRHGPELPFTQAEATLLYLALCVLFLFVVGAAILGIFKALTTQGQIVLTDEGITAPTHVFSRQKTISVLYQDIQALELQTAHGIRYIKIIHNGGKFYVNDNMLPQKSHFDDILNTLKEHCHLS